MVALQVGTAKASTKDRRDEQRLPERRLRERRLPERRLSKRVVVTSSSLGRVVAGASRALLDPPRYLFHGALGLLSIGLLWVGSSPGVPFIPLMGLSWLVAFGALVWTFKLVVHHRRRRQELRPPAGRWFWLAPIGGVLVSAVLVSGLAFHVRWAVSQPSFDEAVVAATDPASVAGASSRRVGLYRVIGEPYVIGDAVFFHHPLGGGVFDDAGFAYLPSGQTPEVDALFESLRTQQIDGAWYRWWSSW